MSNDWKTTVPGLLVGILPLVRPLVPVEAMPAVDAGGMLAMTVFAWYVKTK